MRILNWNTQADKLRAGTPKFERLHQLVASHDADVICLTEALPELMPEGEGTVKSHLSDWKPEARGARKVLITYEPHVPGSTPAREPDSGH